MQVYPKKIPPNRHYKLIQCDLAQHYLIRSTHSKDILDEATGFVKEKCICDPSEQIKDLSTSLLGIFNEKHIPIDLTRDGAKRFGNYCEPDTIVDPPIFEQDYTLNYDKGYWTIQIGKINNTKVHYPMNNPEFIAICKVQHTPAYWNYWHFSINWETNKKLWHELPDKDSKKLSKKLRHEAKAHIKMFAKHFIPETAPILEKEHYQKGYYERAKNWFLSLFKSPNTQQGND